MIALALLLAAAVPAQPPVMAVLELRNELEGPDRNLLDAAFLTDIVRQQALEAVPSLKLITRENVLTLLEASGKRLEECEGECEVDTGRRLGADVIATGELLRFGNGFRANLRLHDTHSAQLLSAAVASGDSPEALEKDLTRAVAKLMLPLGGGRLAEIPKSPEWYETIGLYLTLGYGSISSENNTPRTLAAPANSLTLGNLRDEANDLGLGLRYSPWKWLMLDGAYLFNTFSTKVDAQTGDGNTASGLQTLTAPSVPLSVNGVVRPFHALLFFAGAGGQIFFGRIDPDHSSLSSVNLANAGGSGGVYRTNASFSRFFARLGVEWRPQERVGIGLFGVWYPVSQEVDIYVHSNTGAEGTAAPVLKYTLPRATVNGSLAFYF